MEGKIVIPGFVLGELRHIADSQDPLRRAKGRRGLDILDRLQKELKIPVEISDLEYEDLPDSDAKLLRLAKELGAKVITNDFNLNKVAKVQDIAVLNVNELANAVKPVLLPGEELSIRVVKQGKDTCQGVGYLEDGTMIVVENGGGPHRGRAECVCHKLRFRRRRGGCLCKGKRGRGKLRTGIARVESGKQAAGTGFSRSVFPLQLARRAEGRSAGRFLRPMIRPNIQSMSAAAGMGRFRAWHVYFAYLRLCEWLKSGAAILEKWSSKTALFCPKNGGWATKVTYVKIL